MWVPNGFLFGKTRPFRFRLRSLLFCESLCSGRIGCHLLALGFGLSLLRCQTIGLGLSAAAGIFLRLSFGLGFAFRSFLGFLFGFALTFQDGLLFCRYLLLLLLLQSQDSRIFGHLRSSASYGSNGRSALLAAEIVLGTGEKILGFMQTVPGVVSRPRGFGDSYCIACFEQVQWHLGIGGGRGELGRMHINRILPAFEHIESSVNGFFPAFGFPSNHILYDHERARPGDGKIGFRGYDQPKCLQIGGDLQICFSFVGNDFTEIHGTSFRGDRPQHVRQVLDAKLVGRLQAGKLGVDLQAPSFAIHFSPADGLGHEAGSLEVDGCRAATMTIVNSFRGTRNYVDPKDGNLIHGLNRSAFLLGGRAQRDQQYRE